jgi:hypothetical protein
VLDIKVKIKLLVIFLVLLIGISPFTYKWWPSGKAQDFFILLIHNDDISTLYKHSKLTSFERISWCNNRANSHFRRNGVSLTQTEVSSDLEAKEFLAYASTKDIGCFTVVKDKGEWLVTASYDGHKSELNGMSAVSQIARYYYFVEKPDDQGCTERGDSQLKLLSCRTHFFSNWYMLEETMTSLREDVLADDI